MANVNISIALQGIAQVNGSIRALQSSLTRLGVHGREAAMGLSLVAAPLSAIFAAIATGRAVAGITQTADSFTNLSARINTVSTSAEHHASQMKAVFDIAQETRTPVEAVAKTYARLAIATKRLGVEQHTLVQITSTLIKAQILSGSTAEEAAGGMIQLTQAMAKGKLDGDELRSVFENMPIVVEEMELATKRSRGELYKLASQGLITAQVMLGSLVRANDRVDESFRKMPRTVAGAATQLSNSWTMMVGKANAGQGAVSGFTKAMDQLRDIIEDPQFASAMGSFLSFLGNVAVKAAAAFKDFLGMEGVQHNLQQLVKSYEAYQKEAEAALSLPGASAKMSQLQADLDAVNKKLDEYRARLKAVNAGMMATELGQFVEEMNSFVDALNEASKGEQQFETDIKETAKALKKKKDELKLTNDALQAQVNGNRVLARQLALQARIKSEATNDKTGEINSELAGEIKRNDLLTRQAEIVDGLRGPWQRYKDDLIAIQELQLPGDQLAEAHANLTHSLIEQWTGVGTAIQGVQQITTGFVSSFSEATANMLVDGQANWQDFFKDLQKQMIKFLISQAVMGVLKLVFTLATGGVGGGLAGFLGGFFGFATGGKVGNGGGLIGGIDLNPAAMGGDPGIGIFDIGGGVFQAAPGFAKGGEVPGYAKGGAIGKGTDTVPAMLTPGEYVINRASTKKHMELLKAINADRYASGGMVGGGRPSISRAGEVVGGNTTIVFSGITAVDEIGLARMERRLAKRGKRADIRRYGVTS